MTVFSYVALDTQGVEIRGELDVRDDREARVQLRAQRLRPLTLVEGSLPEDMTWGDRLFAAIEPVMPRAWMPVRSPDLALLFQQLSLMLRSGHALAQALDTAARLTVKHRMREMVADLAHRLRGGQSLSQAMESHGRPFTVLMVQLTSSAEASGELDMVFDRLASDLERKAELKRQTLTTMLYPSIVLLMAIGVFAFLAVSVVPRFASFIEGRGRKIPREAQMLLDLSSWLQQWGAWLAAALTVGLVVLVFAWHWRRTRPALDRTLLVLPLVKGIVRDANMTRTAWTMAMLIKSGATALESLRVVKRVVGNHVYTACFDEAEHRLLAGRSLAKALDQRPIPYLMRHMVAVGESTGQLDVVLDAVAEHYRKSLDARVRLMTSMIEPVLLLFVGAVVGSVYYTFFKTLMSAGGARG